MNKLSDKVLGYLYNPVEDKIGISFIFNPAKKKKGAKVCPDLTLTDVDSFFKTPQSRRSLLAISNAVYDPLGWATPFRIKFKILMKETLSLDKSVNISESQIRTNFGSFLLLGRIKCEAYSNLVFQRII